jgi:hypothetical protein
MPLQSTNCEIWRKPHISESREVALLATRVKRPLIRVPIHLFVDYKDKPAAAAADRNAVTALKNRVNSSFRRGELDEI